MVRDGMPEASSFTHAAKQGSNAVPQRIQCETYPTLFNSIRACTTQRPGIVSKRVESDIETIKKTGHTTQRRRVIYKQFNALHVAKINHEYQFVYHCVAILMGDNSLL